MAPTSTVPRRKAQSSTKTNTSTHKPKQWDDYAYNTLATVTCLAALGSTAYACRSHLPSMITDTASHLVKQSATLVPSFVSNAASAMSAFLPSSLLNPSIATGLGTGALTLTTVGWGGYRRGSENGHTEGYTQGYEKGHEVARTTGTAPALDDAWKPGAKAGREEWERSVYSRTGRSTITPSAVRPETHEHDVGLMRLYYQAGESSAPAASTLQTGSRSDERGNLPPGQSPIGKSSRSKSLKKGVKKGAESVFSVIGDLLGFEGLRAVGSATNGVYVESAALS